MEPPRWNVQDGTSEVEQQYQGLEVRLTYQVIKNSEMSCLSGLSRVHWLMYAASRGAKERYLEAGSKVQGEASAMEALGMVKPSLKAYAAGCAGSRAAYIWSKMKVSKHSRGISMAVEEANKGRSSGQIGEPLWQLWYAVQSL